MRFGIQTILWGHNPADYQRMFDVIEDAGFEGVELFQYPRNLPPLRDLLKLLLNRKRPLELLGLAGGSLQARKDYLDQETYPDWAPAGWTPKSPYLDIDEWSGLVEQLIENAYRLAVHPKYLKQINSANDATTLLRQNTRLLYVPDTAHSFIKREDIREAIAKHSDRLAGVHFMDWRPGFGRASALYARGFTELGNGTVEPEPILKYLRENLHYQGWVVLEQDYTEGLAEERARRSPLA